MANLSKEKIRVANKQFVSFSLGGEIYGMDILMTESIERMSGITRVPKTSPYVVGVTNIRGDIIPVVDLRKRLGLDSIDYDDDTRIIISVHEDYKVGLVVDKVNDVFSVAESDIQKRDGVFKENDNEHISHIIKLDDGYILILDLLEILELEVSA